MKNKHVNLELMKTTNINILEIGTDDIDIGATFYQLLNFVKKNS